MRPVTAVDTTFLPEASRRQMSSRAPIGFISPCGMYSTQSASRATISSRILGGRDTDGADAADVADVAAGLGVAVDEAADEVQIGALVHGGDGMAADGSGGPLNDAQHAVKLTVRTTRQAAP